MKNSTSILLQSAAPLFSCLGLVLVIGSVNLLAGSFYDSRKNRNGNQPIDLLLVWSAAVTVAILVFVLAWTGFDILESGSGPAPLWMLGWILPRREAGAIALGARVDIVSVLGCGLSALMTLLAVVFLAVEKRGRGALLLVSSLLFGQVAASLSWLSVGPWLSFPALMLALLSGCIGLGLEWRAGGAAGHVARFAMEKSCGILLAVSGIAALPSRGVGNPAVPALPASSDLIHGGSFVVGMALFVIGVSFFLQPFPLLGRLTRFVGGEHLGVLFLGAAFPAWVALGVFARNYALIEAAGLLESIGWSALILGLLSAVAGLFQKSWLSASSILISCVFLAAVAALGFVGISEALALGAGPLMAGLGISVFAASDVDTKEGLEPEAGKDLISPSRAYLFWAVALAWAVTGGLGFVGAAGWFSIMARAIEGSTLLVGVGFALYTFSSALSAHALSLALAQPRPIERDFTTVRTILLVASLGALLGLIWTGRPSGLGSNAFKDALFSSPLPLSKGRALGGDAGVQALLSGIGIIGFALAFWGRGVSRKWLASLSARAPRFSRFVASGYGMDAMFSWWFENMRTAGGWVQRRVDESLFGVILPRALESVFALVGVRAGKWDSLLTEGISRISRFGVTWFAAGIQAIQTGSVQWYVALGLVSGTALLIQILLGWF